MRTTARPMGCTASAIGSDKYKKRAGTMTSSPTTPPARSTMRRPRYSGWRDRDDLSHRQTSGWSDARRHQSQPRLFVQALPLRSKALVRVPAHVVLRDWMGRPRLPRNPEQILRPSEVRAKVEVGGGGVARK